MNSIFYIYTIMYGALLRLYGIWILAYPFMLKVVNIGSSDRLIGSIVDIFLGAIT